MCARGYTHGDTEKEVLIGQLRSEVTQLQESSDQNEGTHTKRRHAYAHTRALTHVHMPAFALVRTPAHSTHAHHALAHMAHSCAYEFGRTYAGKDAIIEQMRNETIQLRSLSQNSEGNAHTCMHCIQARARTL